MKKKKGNSFIHGESKRGGKETPEFAAFCHARHRCECTKTFYYKNYGGRGIKFLFSTFNEFLSEIGRRPTKTHSLDRIDNNGNYEKGNIRWATPKEQCGNTRKNVVYNGEIAADAGRRLGGTSLLIITRLRKGWSIEKAFTEKSRYYQQTKAMEV